VSVRVPLQGSYPRADYTQLRIKSMTGLPSGCRVIVNSATVRYRTSSFEHAFVDDLRVNDDIDLPKITVSVENGWEVTIKQVAQGDHLDPRFTAVAGQTVDLRDFYRVDPPVPATRVSLPTRGVFAEAVMGACNACEQIDDTRFWRWGDAPIDEPPSIEPAS